MIEVTSNMGEVAFDLKERIQGLKNPSGLLRTVALAILPEMRKRVHDDGKDASGGQIGTYSPGYMKVRMGTFNNSDKYTKGKKKGEVKNSGVFTKGKSAGSERPRYNRGPDTKVILSLTSQMENDMSVIDLGSSYGIGYLNPFNLKKALWNEAGYKKEILSALSKGELELVVQVAENYVEENIQ